MKKISIIIDPNGLHIEKNVGIFTDIRTLSEIWEIVNAFIKLDLNLEKDEEEVLCFWANNQNGVAMFYVKVEDV